MLSVCPYIEANDDYHSTEVDTDLMANVWGNDFYPPNAPGCTDVDVTFTWGSPGHGTLISTNDDGQYTYRPDSGYSGEDSFEYTAAFDVSISDDAMVYITVGTVTAFNEASLLDDTRDENEPTHYEPITCDCSCSCSTGSAADDRSKGTVDSFGLRNDSRSVSPNPTIELHTSLSWTLDVPDQIRGELSLNGVDQGVIYYDTTGLNQGDGTRFLFEGDASGLATGRYDYEITLGAYEWVVGTQDYALLTEKTFSESVDIVKRTTSSAIDPGWSFAGIGKLTDTTDGMLLDWGGSEAWWFDDIGGGDYARPQGYFADLEFDDVADEYTLTHPDGLVYVFDVDGLMTERKERSGLTTTYTYNVDDTLKDVTDDFGRTITLSYVGGKLDEITDYAGRVTEFARPASDKFTITRPDPDGVGSLDGPITTYEYNTDDRVDKITLPNDDVYDYTYSFGRVSQIDRGTISTLLKPFTTVGLPSGTEGTSSNPMDVTLPFEDTATYTDGEGNAFDYQTGPQGDLTFHRTPADGESHYFRDADGLLTKLVVPDPNSGEGNEQILYENDSDGNRTKATYPDSSEEVWTYGTDGTLTSYTDQLGRTTTYEWTSGQITKMIDPSGMVTKYGYNTDKLIASVTVEDGYATAAAYNTGNGQFVMYDANATGFVDKSFFFSIERIPIAGDWDNDGEVSGGMYDPATQTFLLRDDQNSGGADYTVQITGLTGVDETWLPLAGNWDGSGGDGVGLYDPVNGNFHLRNSATSSGSSDLDYGFGPDGWTPIVGDWDGDGDTTPGVYNPASTQFYMKNSHTGGNADIGYKFGSANLVPITGDWDNDGEVTVGVFTDSTSTFELLNSHPATNSPDPDVTYGFGPDGAGWLPIAGNWDGLAPSGAADTVGLYKPVTGDFFLRNAHAGGAADVVYRYADWIALAGDWNDDGTQTIGLYDPILQQFQLRDSNSAGDADYILQITGTVDVDETSLPFVGDWDNDGDDGVGLFEVADSRFFLRDTISSTGDPDVDFEFGPNGSDWLPIAGDWDGDGDVTAGLYDPDNGAGNGKFYLRNVFAAGNADYFFTFGEADWVPLAGNWDGSDFTTVGAFDPDTGVYHLENTTSADAHTAGSATVDVGFPFVWSGSAVQPFAAVYDTSANVITYAYDATDEWLLKTITLPDAEVITYNTYDDELVTQTTDELGNVTDYTYDDLGRILTITLPDPDASGSGLLRPVITYAYNNDSELTSITDPAGNVTTYTYDDSLGRLWKITEPDPDGMGGQDARVTVFTYDDDDRLKTVTDPDGNVTTYLYDTSGRLIKITEPDPDGGGGQAAAETEFQYDDLDRLTKVIDPLDKETTYAYFDDFHDWVKTITLPDSSTLVYAYDDAGQLTSTTDEEGRTTSYTYDSLGRPLTTTLPDPDGAGGAPSPVASSLYDVFGLLAVSFDPLGNPTSYAYDDVGQLTSVTDPLGGITSYAYNDAGWLTSLTDPVGNATVYGYDNLGRVTTETNELSDVRTYVYNDDMELEKVTDRNGRVTEFDYDDLYRLTEERWLDAQQATERTFSYTYDILNRLTVVEDEDDQSTTLSKLTYTYDNLGRVDTSSNSGTPDVPVVVLDSDYDLRSSRTQLAATVDATADFTNTYNYNDRGFLNWVKQTGTGVADKRVDFTFFDDGQFKKITRYSDLTATNVVATSDYLYDDIGRLTDLTHKDGSVTPVTLADYDWVYDAASRITSFVSSQDGTVDYTYDAAGQLLDADFDYVENPDEDYTYDLNGNRTTTGYTTGDNNQLTADGTYTYLYDDEGNRTKRTETSSGDYVEYEWDHRNRLTKVSFYDNLDALVKEIEYRYDAFDRRIAKLLDSNGNGTIDSEEHFVYDGTDIVLQYDDAGSLTNRYLHGPAVDQILADEDDLGDVLWPLADNQGTVRDLVDDNGDVQNHLTYDAFGKITSESDDTVDHLFAYTGREWDEDAELYYYRARWYDPAVGRFLSEDPIGFNAGDTNLNRYVSNSPANLIDPSGMNGYSDFLYWWYDRDTDLPPFRIGRQPIAPPTPPGPRFEGYWSYVAPWNNPQGRRNGVDYALIGGKWVATATYTGIGGYLGGLGLTAGSQAVCAYGGPALSGSGAVIVGASGRFSDLMGRTEAIRYQEYWQRVAPRINPGITRMDWLRISGRTGRLERSRVIFDGFGRQIYRIDFTDHMRPIQHTNPHLHEFIYGPGRAYGQNILHCLD